MKSNGKYRLFRLTHLAYQCNPEHSLNRWLILGFFCFSFIHFVIGCSGLNTCFGLPKSGITYFFDDFTGSSLSSEWHWVREDPSHYSFEAVPGHLQITSQYGDLWSWPNDGKNLLLQDLPNDPVDITMRVKACPTTDFQHVGVFIHQDDDNYVRIY